MTEKRLIDLTIDWYPDESNDIIAICHIGLGPEADRMKLSYSLTERFGSNMLFSFPFSNLPNQLAAFLWTNSMKQMEDLKEKMRNISGVKSVTLNVLQIGYMHDTWRDKPVVQRPTRE